jgi:predicted GNAT superfamily acetyltransferase
MQFFLDKLSINFNILGSIMLDRSMGNVNHYSIITYNFLWFLESYPSFSTMFLIIIIDKLHVP